MPKHKGDPESSKQPQVPEVVHVDAEAGRFRLVDLPGSERVFRVVFDRSWDTLPDSDRMWVLDEGSFEVAVNELNSAREVLHESVGSIAARIPKIDGDDLQQLHQQIDEVSGALELWMNDVLDLAVGHRMPMPNEVHEGSWLRLLDTTAATRRDQGEANFSLYVGPVVDRATAERMTRVAVAHDTALAELLEQPFFDSEAASYALGSDSTTNPRRAASDHRRAGKLLGLPRGRTFVYPQFQFELAARRLHPVVAEVNQLLGAATDPLGVASWWATPNDALDAQAPMAAIEDPEFVHLITQAATAAAEPVG